MDLSFRTLIGYVARRAPHLLGRKGVEVLSSLLVFSVLARTLSATDFAIYNLILGFIAIAQVTSLPGLGNALAQSVARGIYGPFGRWVSLSVAGSAVGALALLMAAGWHQWVGEERTASAIAAAAMVFVPAVGLLYWRHVLVGQERYGLLSVWDGVASGVRALAVVVWAVYLPDHGLYELIVVSLIAPAMVYAAATLWVLLRVPSGSGEAGAVSYGFRVSVYELPTFVAQQIDKLALFYLVSAELSALYAAALRVPALVQMVMDEANATLGPLFARLSAFGTQLNRFVLAVSGIYLVGCALVAVFVVPVLVPLLAGEQYHGAIIYAQIMTAGLAIGTAGRIKFRFVKSQRNSRCLLQITGSQAFANVALAIALTYWFGLEGTVAAFILKGVVASAVTAYFVRRNFPG